MPDSPSATVFGRQEGSGEAQIFGAPMNPLGVFFNRTQESARIKALREQEKTKRLAEREEQIDEYAKWKPEDGWDWQKEELQKDVVAMRDTFFRALADNPNATASQVFNSKQLRSMRDAIEIKAAKSKATQEVVTGMLNDLDEGKYPNADKKFVSDRIKKMVASGGIDDVDLDKVIDIVNHPAAFDRQKFLKNAVENMKSQSKVDLTVVDNGIWRYLDKTTTAARFVDENGNPGITDNLIKNMLDSSDEFGRSVRYKVAEDIASRSGRSVDEVFGEIENSGDPQVVQQVYDVARADLEKFQQVENKNELMGFGKSFMSSDDESKPKGKFDDVEIMTSEITANKNLPDIDPSNEVAGVRGISVRVPIAGDKLLTLEGQSEKGTRIRVTGFDTNNDGDVVIVGEKSDGTEVKAPFTGEVGERNIAKLKNLQSSKKDADSFEELIQRIKSHPKQDMFLDRPTLENVSHMVAQASNGIINTSYPSKKAKQEAVDKIKSIVSDLGIEDEVSASIPWIGDNKIMIGDEEFNLKTPTGQSKLSEFLFKKARDKFVTDQKPEQKPEPEPEPLTPEEKAILNEVLGT